MNPDLVHDIREDHCIRTVYVTAGDSGGEQFYWLGREQGSEKAYSKMLGLKDDIWVHRIVKLADNQYITVANPRGNTKVSLIFMHLPDGNLKGQGFKSTRFESLAKLNAGSIKQVHSVDKQSSYTSEQLGGALISLMHIYQPAEIRTQSSFPGSQYPDHSDHINVGVYTKKARNEYDNQQYEDRVTIPLSFYIGYPIHERPENVTGTDLNTKEDIFLEYGKHDMGVCQSLDSCIQNQAYGAYLKRQYQNDN